MLVVIMSGLSLFFFCAWLYEKDNARENLSLATEYLAKLIKLKKTISQPAETKVLVDHQTTLYGHELTERKIAEWLESQWDPFKDLTDFEDSRQIAERIRNGEYLGKGIDDEVLQIENESDLGGNKG